jgi:hypothetical protein
MLQVHIYLIILCINFFNQSLFKKKITMKMPSQYEDLINPLIKSARVLLEGGGIVQPMAYIGNSTTKELMALAMDPRSNATKDSTAMAIQTNAARIDADFILIVMEAVGLKKKNLLQYKEIYEKYGSIAASPYSEDIISFSLEAEAGVWAGSAPLKPKPPSKKRRIFGEITFVFADGVDGRFVGLLPRKAKQPVH